MSHIINATDESFEAEVINSDTPVLVDYWAEWCGPCKMIAPVLEQIAEHYGEKLKVVKVDVDSNKIFAQKHGVRNIPTLMLFKNGQVQETKTGALSKTQLQEFIDQSL